MSQKWSIELYKSFFNILEKDLLGTMEQSRRMGKILKYFNSTFLTCIPKVNPSNTFEDFQPISKWNVIYKIISKLVVSRIKPLLSNWHILRTTRISLGESHLICN
jgi:hypothetical protein